MMLPANDNRPEPDAVDLPTGFDARYGDACHAIRHCRSADALHLGFVMNDRGQAPAPWMISVEQECFTAREAREFALRLASCQPRGVSAEMANALRQSLLRRADICARLVAAGATLAQGEAMIARAFARR